MSLVNEINEKADEIQKISDEVARVRTIFKKCNRKDRGKEIVVIRAVDVGRLQFRAVVYRQYACMGCM